MKKWKSKEMRENDKIVVPEGMKVIKKGNIYTIIKK